MSKGFTAVASGRLMIIVTGKKEGKKLADVARLTSKRVPGMGEEVRGLAFRRQTSLFVLRTVQNRIS